MAITERQELLHREGLRMAEIKLGLMATIRAIALLVLWAAVFPVASFAQPVAETEAGFPQTVAQDFYRWYLRGLSKNGDPMHDEAATFSRFVTAALAREIERKIASPDGLDADYFIRAQDYLDDWLDRISVGTPRIKGGTAVVAVTLGPTGTGAYRLVVTLAKEDGIWKIRKVSKS